MKVICKNADECSDGICPHRGSHEPGPGCDHACGEAADARCVVDAASLPRLRETGTTAIFIKRRLDEKKR